jgi:predicted nuclease of predicted toxin-antitoxin system
VAAQSAEIVGDDRARSRRVKFLIDECLSPELVGDARAHGHMESTHVTWLGIGGRRDWLIVRRAVDNGYVLVTNNTEDFTALLAREELHAGLVCLNAAPGLMSLAIQQRLFALALERLPDEPINEVLEITLKADRSILIDRYDLPSAT